jgi:hypothetical protein
LFGDPQADREVVGEPALIDRFAHAAERARLLITANAGVGKAQDLHRLGQGADRRGGGGHVLVHQDLVEHVRIAVEVKAALRNPRLRPDQIPQARDAGGVDDLAPLPRTQTRIRE